MKKRRMLAVALATSMVFSSFSSVTFADESTIPANTETADDTDEVEVDTDAETEDDADASDVVDVSMDDATSSAALRANAVDAYWNGGLQTNVAEDGEWKATVSGDAGGDDNVSGATKYYGTGKNKPYTGLPYYSVMENDDGTVSMRMGLFNDSGSCLKQVGKVATGTEGFTMYYKNLKADDSFEISATATIKNIDSDLKQVSFGILVRDEEDAMTNYNDHAPNTVAVGPVQMANAGKSNDSMTKGFVRINDSLMVANSSSTYYNMDLANESSTAPAVGDTIDLKLRKNGDVYTLTYGNQTPVVLNNPTTMEGDIVAGLFVSRAVEVDFSNIQFKTISDEYTSIKIENEPDKTSYLLGTDLDTTGLKVVGTKADGTKEVLDSSEYDVVGYDEVKNTAGTFPVSVVYGKLKASFNVEVAPLSVSSLSVTYPTARTTFFTGTKFSDVGLVVSASFNDGTTKNLDSGDYVLKIDGKTMDDETYFTDDMVGTKSVVVSYREDDPNVEANGKTASFDIKVQPAEVDFLTVASMPAKTTYYLGDEFDSAGLVVKARYLVNGTYKYQALQSSEYTLDGFDSSAVAKSQTITVTLKSDPTKTTSFNIQVKQRRAVSTQLATYPRTTVEVGEDYDASGIEASIVYDNDDVESMNNDVVYYYDGSRYYTKERVDEDDVREDDGTYTVDSAFMSNADTAPDYYIDLSEYDSSAVGKTSVTIVYKDFANTKLSVTVTEPTEHIWKANVFGASSLGFPDASTPTGPAEIYVNDTLVGASNYDQSIGFMKNGSFTNVNSIRLNAWDKAGKTSTGVDGLAYYYTRISADNNFTLSADIKVNRYIVDPDTESGRAAMEAKRESAEKLLGRAVTDEELIDMCRDGQENFGMEALDAMPLFAKDTEGDDNLITADSSKAQLDQYGEPINIWEAYLKGMSAVDYMGNTRQVAFANVTAGFATNLVLAGGYSGATRVSDVTASNYYKSTHLNRINLMVKKGISDYMVSTGGTRMDPYPTTDSVPMKNDRYNITLQKINYGYKITTYDYQTGETKSNYSFTSTDQLEDLLVTQADKDNVWIGFYAARWADITVSDVHLYETSPATDPVISNLTDDTYSPSLTLSSSVYTSTCNYNLILKVNNKSGGTVTIRQGDEEVYTDEPISKKGTIYPVTLEPDSKTEFTVTYTPSRADDCVSYEPVVERYLITNKSIDSELENLYVAPDGKVTGDGTRENPLDLETAIGLVKLGQKVVMLDGTYNIRERITIPFSNSGTPTSRRYVVADEGAEPVIDLRGLSAGIQIAADYWVFKGITMCNALGNTKCFELGADHVTVEDCVFRDNGDTGLQISRVDSAALISEWPGYNLIKNCESYNNADPSKNNADGFAAKLTSGYGNIFQGCISHHNVDDGWDLYTKIATGPIGPVTLDNCVAYANGYELYDDGTDGPWADPDGCNGFKTGGENLAVFHYLKDSLTFDNLGSGIDSNFNPALKVRNVISYNNQKYNVALYSGQPQNYDFDMKGLVSYKGVRADRLPTVSYDENITYTNGTSDTAPILSSSNYFIYGFNEPYDEETADSSTVNKLDCWSDESVFNSHFGFKNYTDVGSKLSYTTLKELAAGEYDLNSYNSDLEKIDDSFFKSLDESTVLTGGRYSRAEDGSFILGDFLARTTEYVHDAGDEVDYSKVEFVEATTSEATEATTSAAVETTKKVTTDSDSTYSSRSGGGSSSRKASSQNDDLKASYDTSKSKTEDKSSAVAAKSFVTPSGVVITPPVSAGVRVNFTDIANRAWAVDSINKLAQAGVVSGVSSTSFAPDAYSKRADFIVMLVKTFGLTGNTSDNFADVQSGKYYANALSIAKVAGIATGYGDGNFGPENTITRQDMMVLVAKALEFAGVELDTNTAVLSSYADSNSIADYAKPYVAALVNAGLATGTDNGIEPTALITRAQMSVLVAKVYDTVLALAESYSTESAENVTEDVSEETTVEASDDATESVTETAEGAE